MSILDAGYLSEVLETDSMRLEATNKPDQYKVWLTDRELSQLRHRAESKRNDLLIQLDGHVGLRAFEIPQVCSRHVKRTDDGEHYRLRVPKGRIRPATVGSHGTSIFLRVSSGSYTNTSKRTTYARPTRSYTYQTGVRAVVRRVANTTADETGKRTTATFRATISGGGTLKGYLSTNR